MYLHRKLHPDVEMSIAEALTSALRSFNSLVEGFQARAATGTLVSFVAWQDALGRLRMWAANTAAHESGQSSLDFRLRDASHVSTQILSLLRSLAQTIKDIKESLDKGTFNDDMFKNSLDKGTFSDVMYKDGDGESTTELQQRFDQVMDEGTFSDDMYEGDHGESTTELQQLFDQVMTVIDCLYQLSPVIRKPAAHDRLLDPKYEQEAQVYEQCDVQHASNKYPDADPQILYRLRCAITRRRGHLKYRQRHHAKLAHGIDLAQGLAKSGSTEGHSEIFSDTVATTFMDSPTGVDDRASDTEFSETSCDSSILGTGAISVPSPPNTSADGKPFECPYCFSIFTIRDRPSWTRHVRKDLQPYACTFKTRSTAHQLYGSRHKWFEHEITRRQPEWLRERFEGGPISDAGGGMV